MAGGRLLDNLRHGADVFTADGKRVGVLHAIVLNPENNSVTDVAVNTGPHFPEPGFGDPRIVNVEMKAVRQATEKRIDLDVTEAQFRELPLYGHTHFFDVPDDEEPETAPGVSRLWNAAMAIGATLANLGAGIAIPAEHFRKASFERHILNDAPVWRIEPNTHIGDVERVLVDEESDEIEALVIRRGVVFHEDVVLPMQYVREIRDGLIHVQLTNEDIEKLEPFRRG